MVGVMVQPAAMADCRRRIKAGALPLNNWQFAGAGPCADTRITWGASLSALGCLGPPSLTGYARRHFYLAKPPGCRQTVTLSATVMEQIVILDFVAQYTHVIARRVRECKVYSTILRYDTPATEIAALTPNAIILSRRPASGH